MKRILSLLLAWALILGAPLSFGQVTTDATKTGIARSPHLLCSSAAGFALTGSTSETTLTTCTIPAGAMGTAGGLRIHTFWTTTNSANNKTLRVRLGGVSGTQYVNAVITTAGGHERITTIRNRNATNSQYGGGAGTFSLNNSGVSGTTSSVDTAASVDLVFSGQLALGSETITLEAYEVWVLP